MPKVSRTDITDPVTPSKLEVVLKPIRLLQINGRIDEQNFLVNTAPSYGVPLHAGSLIRNINDLVDSAKTFDGRSIFTDADFTDGTFTGSVASHYANSSPLYDEKAFFEVHAQVVNALYTEEYTIRDIDYKLSYTREDIKASFRTMKELKNKLEKANSIVQESYAESRKMGMVRNDYLEEKYKKYSENKNRLTAQINELDKYEFITLSQSIEVEVPRGYAIDSWEIFGDLDWGWKNAEGEATTAMQVGVLYVETDVSRDDFVNFKFSILFDQDVSLSADDYVMTAGKIQYRLKRYA